VRQQAATFGHSRGQRQRRLSESQRTFAHRRADVKRGARLTQFARNHTDTPVHGTVRVIGFEARVAGYKTSATFNRIKA
jgi:hypothetical protein